MRNTKKSLLLPILLLTGAVAQSCRAQVTTENVKSQTNVFLDGTLNATQRMSAQRASHTATLLNNGKVLIGGGFVGEENILASVEIFDPQTNGFLRAENMRVQRSSHTATLLPNGKVLIAGGFNGNYLDSAEIYDSATGKFTSTPKMTMARSGHVAVLLNNGKVLLAGGIGTDWTFLDSAEIYDPASNTFTQTGAMTTPRESHTLTLLKDGRVLITGGHQGRRTAITIYSNCEIYNPSNGTFALAGNLIVKRHKHDAVLLVDGRVLIVGGSDERDGAGAYRNAEIYNPTNNTFAAVSNMNASRYKLQGTAVLLKNGKVLIAGGANRAEVFNPTNNTFSFASGDMGTIRLFATATLLQNGRVLIVGGYDDRMAVSSNAWIYKV